jgi:hypothetical protein
MAEEGQKPIIVKRIKKGGHGHHGGAWKIAYADFVTAMMAFFLLMWLLGSTTKGDMEGIAQYFKTPLKVAMAGGSGAGDSNSILQGGGQDLTRRNGHVKRGESQPDKKNYDLKSARALEHEEAERLAQLKRASKRPSPPIRCCANTRTSCCSTSPPKACASRSSTRRTGRCSRPPGRPAALCARHPRRAGPGAERRPEPHQPVRPHRFDALHDGFRLQ